MEGSQSSHHLFAKRVGKFASATLLSRILGYIRDASVAFTFGGGMLTDSFYTAFRISNLLRRLLGEGALSSSFNPVFSKSILEDTKEETKNFVRSMFSSLIVNLTILVFLGILFTPMITHWIAPGFKDWTQKYEMTVLLTRCTFPFFLFISLAALTGAVLNAMKHFFLPALAPAMLSVVEISYLIIIIPVLSYFFPFFTIERQVIGLSIAVVLGALGHFLIQLPLLYKEGFSLKWRWDWRNRRSLQVTRLMLPAMVGLSVEQINAFVDTICATFLVEGSVTALYNSNRLMQLPLALFGISIASVSLPTLSDHFAENNFHKLKATVRQSLRSALFVVIPASIGLIFLAHSIIALLFEHGKFTAFATVLTRNALWGYTLGLPAYCIVKILANTFYALHKPKIPVKISALCISLNVVLNLILMEPLGVGGLALATAISSWTNAVLLYLTFKRHLKEKVEEDEEDSKGLQSFYKILLASVGMSLYLMGLEFFGSNLQDFMRVLLGIGGGVLLYFVIAKILHIEELKLFTTFFTTKKG